MPLKIPKTKLEEDGDLLFIKIPLVIIMIAFLISLFGYDGDLMAWMGLLVVGFACIWNPIWIFNKNQAIYAEWRAARKNRLIRDIKVENDKQARDAGYLYHGDRENAKRLGFTDVNEWRKHQKAAAKIEKAESEKANKRRIATKKSAATKRATAKVREAEKDKKLKAAKIQAFKKRNFQIGHNQASYPQKERIWSSSSGCCSSCRRSSLQSELSFWWRVYPKLEVVLLCDKCAKKEDLIEEQEIIIEKRSRVITEDVRDAVWRRDDGKCTQCGSNENLEFDHIIPHSKGGANTKRNIQLLCEPCNRKKSDKIG